LLYCKISNIRKKRLLYLTKGGAMTSTQELFEIVKKSELKANSEIKTQESKVQSENKIVKKERSFVYGLSFLLI